MSDTPGTRVRDFAFRGLRVAFRLLPLRESTRDRLRGRFFQRYPGISPMTPKGQPAAGSSRRAVVRSDEPAIGWLERRDEALPAPLPATLVAFYLPQFHVIPQNDSWWGRGFSEWRNVGRALPQFEGHAQPRLPGELGYYDLRNPAILREQATLASEYGIGAFCFYFYWFGGTTLLEAPLEQWLADRSVDFPVCLCWANESWSRRWDGRGADVLIEQAHDAADDLAFIAHVARYLRDPRYLRVDGKPLLLVYRPELMPDPQGTAERWRTWCSEQGIGEITIACVQGFERPDPRKIGFDAAVEFPPNLASPDNITSRQRLLDPGYNGEVLDWRQIAAGYRDKPLPDYRLFPGVNCGWDNEPRRPGRGRTYLHASPRGYRDWLQHTIQERLASRPAADRLVFVNAWNEWAEGAVLEPDRRLGHAWLQATRTALQRAAGLGRGIPVRPCVVVHAWDADAFGEILAMLEESGIAARLVVTTSPEREAAIRARLEGCGLAAELEVRENRGRDILPFLHVANRLLDEGEDIVLKLHTKRSSHRADGDQWRRELLSRLLAPARTTGILAAFERDQVLGMVAPEGHVQQIGHYRGANADTVAYLARRIGMAPPDVVNATFVAGSMFWCRLEALRPLLDAHLDGWEFEAEAGQVDGTFAHAVERVFSLVVNASGRDVRTASEACGVASDAPTSRYPYAARG
jgi:lipopolysaccharide biosynthesis protein